MIDRYVTVYYEIKILTCLSDFYYNYNYKLHFWKRFDPRKTLQDFLFFSGGVEV